MRFVFKLALILIIGLMALHACKKEEPGERAVEPTTEKPAREIAREPREMRDEFLAKVKADYQLRQYDIKASVDREGAMTLTGMVPNNQLKQKADQLARTVMGVRSITNSLSMTGEMVKELDLSDRQLRRELERKIAADSELNEYPISVDVDDAEATLKGFVETREQRRKVMALAQTVAGLEQTEDSIRLSAELSDEFLAKIEADSQLREYPITASVRRGNILSMSGTVPNREYRRKAERLARTVWGMRRIDNEIELEGVEFPPERILSDAQLRQELERKIAADHELKDTDISIEITRGEAVVRGTVDTYKEKRKVERLAETVKGISDVDNKIELRPEKEIARQQPVWPRASARFVNDLL